MREQMGCFRQCIYFSRLIGFKWPSLSVRVGDHWCIKSFKKCLQTYVILLILLISSPLPLLSFMQFILAQLVSVRSNYIYFIHSSE